MSTNFIKNRQLEQEANYFAMCLLMPDFLIKREVEKIGKEGLSETSIKQLSEIFAVTQVQMTIRLSQLGYFKK